MTMLQEVVILLIVWTAVLKAAPDSAGKEFILGFMENKDQEPAGTTIFITTAKTANVYVHVEVPLLGIMEDFNATSGVVEHISLSKSICMSGTSKDSKGVLISADDEVIVFGLNSAKYSADVFLGLPTDVLGREYYAITYSPASVKCEVLVVATQNMTTVAITFGKALGNYTVIFEEKVYGNGQSLQLTMNRYDTFQFQSEGDLSGTHVSADQPIAVFSGNVWTSISGGSGDHLVEQLTPVSVWGKKFITVPIPQRTVGDYFRFMSSNDGTTVNITCGTISSFNLERAGDSKQRNMLSTDHCYVEADKPILVAQFCKSNFGPDEGVFDPAMLIIPPVEQFSADYAFATPQTYNNQPFENFFMFVVKESEKDGLRIDNEPFPSTTEYHSVSGIGFVAGYIPVPDGSHIVRHTSPISVFGGYLFGRFGWETYGFATGMRMSPINTPCNVSDSVVGDLIDNDCDGRVDEEICTGPEAVDNDGDGKVDEDCAMPSPVDGNWTAWGLYSACSVTCTENGSENTGTQLRTRQCEDPSPAYNGKQCEGLNEETRECTASSICPVAGGYGEWISWGECSVTCGNGTRARNRSCDNPVPQHGGNCTGSDVDQTVCALPPCPECRCYIRACAKTNYTVEEMTAILEELKAELLVPVATLSSYKRAHTSANDDRPSAKAAGIVGCAIFAILGALLLIMDAGNLLYMVKRIKRDISS